MFVVMRGATLYTGKGTPKDPIKLTPVGWLSRWLPVPTAGKSLYFSRTTSKDVSDFIDLYVTAQALHQETKRSRDWLI